MSLIYTRKTEIFLKTCLLRLIQYYTFQNVKLFVFNLSQNMNSNNPLLNRLFETKSSKKKRPNSIKEQVSHRDKILIPKLANNKNQVGMGMNTQTQKQKTVILKPNLTKLPPISQKQILKQPKQKEYLITSQKKVSFRDRKVSFNTTHDLVLFPTQLNLYTHKYEQKQEEEPIIIDKKQSTKKFKTFSSDVNYQKNQQQLFEYLKILEKNQELKQQFCYMNRRELPYSYEIVSYQDINKNQFLTVSLRGVSIYKDGQSEFTTAQKLSRQIQVYRKVKKIDFFSDYILAKTIKHWRFRSIKKKFEGQCKLLGKRLLSQNAIILKFLNFLFSIKQNFIKCKFLDIRITSTGSLQLIKKELTKKQAEIEKSLDYLESEIQTNLKEAIEKNMTKFRKQQRVSLTSNGKQVGQQAFLPYDTKKKSMKYTQIAKLKQFQQSMYKLLKMTDMIRFTIKVQMVKAGLEDYAAQLHILRQKYMKRKEISFVSWTRMQVKIQKPHKNEPAFFQFTPTIQQIQQILRNHLKSLLQKFYKKHTLLIQKKDEYFCESYQPQSEQFPNKLDFKYYVEGNPQFMLLKHQCEQKLSTCLTDTKKIIEMAEQKLLKIYNDSFMTQNVNFYMQNEPLKQYLSNQLKSRQIISSWQQIIEFGIIYFDMTLAIATIRQKYEQKFKYISNAIPVQVIRRCQSLADKIKHIYNIFKENPSTVMEFINFMKNYHEYKKQIDELEKKIDAILQLQDMVYKNGLRIGETSKLHISQCSTYYRQLTKRFEEIEGNQQKERKKFYKIIDDMVSPLDQRSQQLYTKIYEDQFLSSSQSSTSKCMQRLTSLQQQFTKIKQKKQQLFYYQNQLKLGHKDIPNFFKLQSNLQWIIKIWKGRQKYQQFLEHINTKGYAEKSHLQISDLRQFLRDIQLATSQIQFIQLLQKFKQDGLRVLNIIQICKLLSADTLQDDHKKQIKQRLVTQNKKIKDYLFLIEGGRSIICQQLVATTNIIQIKHQLEEVVHSSAQQSLIKKNILEIEQFWKKNKIVIVSEDLSKNGTEILHLGRHQNQRLQQKIGSFLMIFKSIVGSKHAVGQLNNRVIQQVQTCEYLKTLIQKWIQVEREWIKLLPLMTNCPSVKHQSNVYFEFTSLDNSIRKHNRNINDLNTLKKIAEDYSEKRYLTLMYNIERDLKEVNKIFASFLQMKRNTYHRFFFLADQELINILQNTKDAKTLAKYAGYCFNCDKLLLDKELVSGFETPNEVFKLRKGILKGQPDQMFKSVEENMKTSLRFSILSLIPKMKVGMNIQQQHENCLQAVLVADRFLWTEMTQNYLNPTSYQSYQLFLRRACQQLSKFIKKTDVSNDFRNKISIRLVQAMSLRQIGEEMIKLQITKQDFKWKQQKRYHIEQDQIVISQFNRKFLYGLQYYPPGKITIPTENFRMLLSQAYQTSLTNKVLIVTGIQGDGKRNLVLSCAQQYGCFYKELICNKNISVQYIMRFVQGAVLAGAWLSLYQFQHLQGKVLVKLMNEIKNILQKLKKSEEGGQTMTLSGGNNPNQSPKVLNTNVSFPLSSKTIIRTNNRVLFTFITHGFYPEKVSVYQFDSFTLSEPNHKKICQWLLQANNFTDWSNLSTRLICFLETVFPFLQRVMGSFMRILRKIIDISCQKKKTYSYNFKETQIIAQTFKQQILDKSDQNIHQILYEALYTYFNYQTFNSMLINKKSSKVPRKQSFSLDTKLNVLCSLLIKNVKNILVIGPRTNKSTLIRETGQKLQREILTIYPQSSDFFFQDETIQKLNKLDPKQIIHYDGQSIMREWSDLVICQYLLLEGKKIHLNNQLIIQLRAVNNCSPSFVGSCQIVYIGNSLTKRQKFIQISGAGNCESIIEPMTQIFGNQFENLPEKMVQSFGEFFKPYASDPKSKNYHKLIVWFGTVLGIQGLWNKFYAGRYTDVTVNKYSQQLIIIDESKYSPFEEKHYNDGFIKSSITVGNLLVQTKSTILYFELMKNLIQISSPILITGKYNSGKSTLINLLLNNIKSSGNLQRQSSRTTEQKQSSQVQKVQTQVISQISKIKLPAKLSAKDWTKILRISLTNIRRDGKSFLRNVGDNDIIVAVDDLDLGYETHREYLRQLIDLRNLHDDRFQDYTLQKVKIIASWHKQNSRQSSKISKVNESIANNYKLFDRMVELQIPQFSKQSLSTILRANIEHFTKKNNMSKQVINVIDTHLVKCLLIAFDDITNLSGQNTAAGIMLAVMRNLLSLPKKNVLMSAQNYVNYFRIQLRVRMMEKCFTKKIYWQYNSVLDNLQRVIFQNLLPKPPQKPKNQLGESEIPQVPEEILLFQQNQFKYQPISKLKQKITASFSHLYVFDEMLKIIALLNNQLHLIDGNCVLVGRTGTGKVTIMNIVAFLNKMEIYKKKHDLSQCIIKCLRGDTVILLQSYLRRDFSRLIYNSTGTQYQQIKDCLSDEDLEKLITDENMKKQYSALISQIPSGNDPQQNQTKVLRRVLSKLKSIVVFDTIIKFKQASSRFRELNRYFVCYIDEWPSQALLNISGINVEKNYFQSNKQTQNQKQKEVKLSQTDISKLLAEVFTTTNRIIQSYEEPSISIKKFRQFLRIFEILYKNRNQRLSAKADFYSKIYSKFNDACNLIAQWQKRVDVLKIELEQSIVKLQQQIKANKVESVNFTKLYEENAKQSEKILQKNEEMATLKRQMEKQLQGMKKMMENISKIVNSMQRTQMSELKKIYKSSRVVSFGLECLCLLLGQQPIQKSINKILADPNLMMKMKSNKVLENKNARVLEKFKNQYDNIREQYEGKSKVQASRVLIDWIKSILQYWIIFEQHKQLNENYKHHKVQYDLSLKKQEEIEQEIKKLQAQMITLNKGFEELFRKKEQSLQQYNKISVKIRNARHLLPALKKSEQQTWEMIKQLRNQLSSLIGNLTLSTVVLIYLPLKRLKLKKQVLDQIKKLLNIKMVQFSPDFMSLITEIQDAVTQDLNIVAIKQLQQFPVLIVDPERRAMSFLFDHDSSLALAVVSKNLSEMANSEDILQQIKKHMKQNDNLSQSALGLPIQESQIITKQLQQSQLSKYNRKNPILHTTDENYRPLLEKLPENTLIVDWKFTTINTNEKIFLRIAANKKPEYFQAKKDLNRKIKKDIQKIEEYKREIYQCICEKKIKILDDQQFVEMGIKLQSLEEQTLQNKKLEKQKLEQIKQYAKQINEQVTKVIFMVNALKKIKNVALDIILDIACIDHNILENIMKWVLATLEPNKRLGWLLSIAFDYEGEMNEELFAILVKDAPLKMSQIARQKKPISISSKNYENLCKITGYTTNLKNFSETALRNAKQFETWTLDGTVEQIPHIFKPETLNILQQLAIIKIFKPKILLHTIKKHIRSKLKIKKLQGYSNKELLQKTNKKYPIISHCTMQHLEQLCAQLNNSKLCVKNIIEITDSLEQKRFLWAQMSEGNWVILHSVYDRNAREVLQDIVQYVSHYDEQQSFRIFVYIDQVQLTGYENSRQITTKYNNISTQVSRNKKSLQTAQELLISKSKYIENIGINMYEESASLRKNLQEIFSVLNIQIPEVTAETAQQNPTAASFIVPQTPVAKTNIQKTGTPLLNVSALMPNILNLGISLNLAQKQKVYNEKVAIFAIIWHTAAWLKFPKLRILRTKSKLINILQYIKQYNVPLQFNLHAVAGYLGRLYSSPLDTSDRIDAQQLAERILDETKINDRQIFGIPTHKQSIALALAGIGRGGLQIDKNWIDERVKTNYLLLGCQQSYLSNKNTQIVQNMMNVLGEIKLSNRSVKQQVADIRLALARLPTNVLVFNREVKNIMYLHSYTKQQQLHNKNIIAAKQFLEWINISSNQQYKQDQIIITTYKEQSAGANGSSLELFTWENLLDKVRQLTGHNVSPYKIRAVLANWLQILKRKHEFLLYWNLDNPILVLHPVLFNNFPMIVSTYIINYLSLNYQKIKLQGESINQSILYTLQIQFSRQTDQKQLYMTEGILLPDLLYKQFRYNFQFKMLDGLVEWNGEQPAPLIMLKMKKLSPPQDNNQKEKDQDYQSPNIQIATRINNQVQVVYKLPTFIDGNFQEWGLRRPMLISE